MVRKPTKQEREKIEILQKKLKENHDETDWVKLYKEGEELDRLIGWRSLTVEDWFRPFTI